MKTSELEGADLDYWVAMAEGYELDSDGDNRSIRENGGAPTAWRPSTDWSQGGPIIERKAIAIENIGAMVWAATIETREGKEIAYEHGDAPLIAAMRAYVASKFGETVVDKPE